MQKTKIEWCDYTWNPVKGLCPQACWYCYARAMYKRFKWNPKVRLDWREINPLGFKKPQRIFVGSTIDLFHSTIPSEWLRAILKIPASEPQHTFLFLTKNPARYAEFDFPKNCWLGVTVTGRGELPQQVFKYKRNLLFVSYEPLFEICHVPMWSGWNIVGALTGPQAKKHRPTKTMIKEMVMQSHMLGAPVFLKNNLKAVWGKDLIQESPHVPKRSEGERRL